MLTAPKTMSTSIPLISSPVSEPWTAWVLLLLLVLAALANVAQPGVVLNSFTTIVAKPERQYTESQRTVLGQICLHLFQLGTLAMACYLLCFHDGAFSIARYGVILVLIALLYGIKVLMMLLVNYTFQIRKRCASIGEHYEHLICVFCCALYPLMLGMFYYGNTRVLQTLVTLVTAAFLALIVFKYCRAFLQRPSSLLYILLSVMTMDVLPLLGAYYGTNYILSQSFVQL